MTATARTPGADTAIAEAVAAQRSWVEDLFGRLAEIGRAHV